ncbi:MAG: DUF4349 domain-containing protein [Fimbriimonas sp.]
MKAHSYLISFAILIAGCSGPGGSGADVEMASKAVVSGDMAAAPAEERSRAATSNGAAAGRLASQPVTHVARQVIRRADLAVRVPNVEKAEREVNALVQSWQGYVESANSTDLSSDHPALTMAIRVPVGRFDDGIAKLESLGVRLSKTVSSEDVTGQIVDLDARLSTLRAQEETYRGLLRRSSNLESVISLQDKLTEVRGTIESMAAQRKTLGGLAALSNISLRLEQDAVAHAPAKDPNWMAQTWAESTTALGYALRTVTTIGMYVAVFSPFWLPILWIVWRTTRPVRKVA